MSITLPLLHELHKTAIQQLNWFHVNTNIAHLPNLIRCNNLILYGETGHKYIRKSRQNLTDSHCQQQTIQSFTFTRYLYGENGQILKVKWIYVKVVSQLLSKFKENKNELLAIKHRSSLCRIYWILPSILRMANTNDNCVRYFQFITVIRTIFTHQMSNAQINFPIQINIFEMFFSLSLIEMGQMIAHQSFPFHFVNFVCIMQPNKLLPIDSK